MRCISIGAKKSFAHSRAYTLEKGERKARFVEMGISPKMARQWVWNSRFKLVR